MKIKTFTDLIAWQEGHKLAIMVYRETKVFPQEELYALTNQIRRNVISITSNIAEGFSRQTKKEKKQFYYIAIGSVTELQNQLLLARDIDYLPKEDFDQIAEQTIRVRKLIISLVKSAKGISNE